MKFSHVTNRIMKKLTACLLLPGLLLLALPAWPIDLQTAKSRGLVGESSSGYLEAVTTPTIETRDLIKSINDQRKQKYQEIAKRNKTSLQAVEQLAGKKAIEKSTPGSYIRLNGSWKKK